MIAARKTLIPPDQIRNVIGHRFKILIPACAKARGATDCAGFGTAYQWKGRAYQTMINQDQPTTDTAGNEITPEAQAAADEVILLTNVRNCLKRWTHRFAASPHAVAHVKESSDLITKLDARIWAFLPNQKRNTP